MSKQVKDRLIWKSDQIRITRNLNREKKMKGLQKALVSRTGKKKKLSERVEEELNKAKYTKRTGGPGHYKYTYGESKREERIRPSVQGSIGPGDLGEMQGKLFDRMDSAATKEFIGMMDRNAGRSHVGMINTLLDSGVKASRISKIVSSGGLNDTIPDMAAQDDLKQGRGTKEDQARKIYSFQGKGKSKKTNRLETKAERKVLARKTEKPKTGRSISPQALKKEYSNLNDAEKYIIREYDSWKKSDAPIAHKLDRLEYWRKRAKDKGIDHLLSKKED